MTIISIGVTILKISTLCGLGAGFVTGIKWFGKFDPKFKGNTGGRDNESDTIENLRKAVRH